ncbi:MAG: hypothetical protein GY811_18405 [Myxococcales bacterium]|nr:hypothetical protein [Myxococcales bacterium]
MSQVEFPLSRETRPLSLFVVAALASTALLACGDEGKERGDADAADATCVRESRPENGTRYVVVSRPYGEDGMPATTWEVLELAPDGSLAVTGKLFEMGRATGGMVAFTPDGEIGLVAQEDGSLGVFRIGPSGDVTVLHEALTGDFYAGEVVIGEAGTDAFVLSENWRNNGGGVFRVSIGCDGSIEDEGLLAAAKLPRGLLWTAGGAVVAAHDLGDSELALDIHLVADGNFASPVSSTTLFPDRDAIVASMATTADERFVLLGDNSDFSGVENRVGVARITSGAVEAVQVLTPLLDPYAIATSPFDDAAIVVSGFGDAIFKLTYDPASTTTPFVVDGELEYLGADPQLPADLVQITRGDLLGLVLIGENQGVRRVRFDGEGGVTDLGVTATGDSFKAIPGAIGVQP